MPKSCSPVKVSSTESLDREFNELNAELSNVGGIEIVNDEDSDPMQEEDYGFSVETEGYHLSDGTVVFDMDTESLARMKEKIEEPGSTSYCIKSKYGSPISAEKAVEIMSPLGDDSGLVFHARIIPDDPKKQAVLLKKQVLNKKVDLDGEGKIKPRRGFPLMLASEFLSSLVRVDHFQPRWIFSGVLNGWPGYTCFEVISITCRLTNSLPGPLRKVRIGRIWSSDKQGREGVAPHIPDKAMEIRVTLRSAPWTRHGWSRESPGFFFWFEAQRTQNEGGPRVLHGENAVRTMREESKIPTCTFVHMISHRYATTRKETAKDMLTYHSAVLLEWDHGRYCTVMELATYNGLSGYSGKCNWYDDKLADLPVLYACFPPYMIAPWDSKNAEIRCHDVAARNLDEFKAFVERYTGPKLRFLDPHYAHSYEARLSFRSKDQIARYLLNYIGRDGHYSEINRNCQTFAADLCGFIAGKKDVEPFHPLNRVDYTNRSHYFLYDSNMYETK